MVAEKYGVRLPSEDRDHLERLIRSGQRSARVINRARILLKTDEGWSASQWRWRWTRRPARCSAPNASTTKVCRGRIGRRAARPSSSQSVSQAGCPPRRGEAHLIALACSDAPEGHDHWTLRLLADQVVELGVVQSLSYETVRLRLKKTPSSRGGSSSGASPR